MGWTDDRVATLKKLWLEGLSATQIAKQLRGVTRNAVIGKVTRLGLATKDGRERQKPSAPATTRGFGIPRAAAPLKAPPVKRAAYQNAGHNFGASQKAKAPLAIAGNGAVFEKPGNDRPPREIVPARVEAPGSASVLSLGAHMCKWPIGDPAREDFTFCGRRQDPGRVYCREHCQVAYQQPKQTSGTVKNLSAPSVGRGRTFNTVSR